MSDETVTVPLVNGRQLVFRKPDDARAMRILRALFRLSADPTDRVSDEIFYEEVAACLITAPDLAEVAAIAAETPPDHSYLRMSQAAQWLVIQLTSDLPAYARVTALLADLPAGFMQQTSATLRRKPPQHVPRGKQQRGRR